MAIIEPISDLVHSLAKAYTHNFDAYHDLQKQPVRSLRLYAGRVWRVPRPLSHYADV